MKYRKLGRSGIEVSEVGLGCEWLQGKEYDVVEATIDEAIKHGINIFDVFMCEPDVRTNIGRALKGRREKAIIQGHIGSAWVDGQYKRARELGEVKTAFEDLLSRLQTDYIDIGMIHFVDTDEDFEKIFSGPFIEYVKQLKADGVIKTIGLSSHVASVAQKAIETDLIDVLMFSTNPMFDLMPGDMQLDDVFDDKKRDAAVLNKLDPKRMELYRCCEEHGTAITVMKAFMAGRLLKAEATPLGQVLTIPQCINFALSRPAVASVLPGCFTREHVREVVAYTNTTDEERDFSAALAKTATYSAKGQCVYCNHCLPCPARIDIGAVNKYIDLANASKQVPATVREHYKALPANASDCTACGACEKQCPFDVPVIKRMKEAVALLR